MSDLFSPFRDAEQLPTPPAEDVRRRGDTLRRRRQALQAGGVAAVVAAIALAGVGLSGGFTNSSSPNPAPPMPQPTQPDSPTPSEPQTSQPPDSPDPVRVVTAIPADLDLVRDWVDSDGDGTEEKLTSGKNVQWLGDVVECDSSHSPADESVDHTAVRYSMPENLQARDLRTFEDDATAQRIAEDYVSWFADCPVFSIDGGASQTHNEVTSTKAKLGDQAWVVSQTYWMGDQPQLAENALVVVRVANTLLVAQRYGEYSGATNPDATEQMHADFLDEVRPIVADLECTFADEC